jgi:hypothetical protein
MNLDAIFDDLGSEFDRLQSAPPVLADFTVRGFSSVTFGKDHFSGLNMATGNINLVAFSTIFSLVAGESRVSKLRLAKAARSITGHWIAVQTAETHHQGRLLAVSRGILLFRDCAVPVSAVQSIEILTVDN